MKAEDYREKLKEAIKARKDRQMKEVEDSRKFMIKEINQTIEWSANHELTEITLSKIYLIKNTEGKYKSFFKVPHYQQDILEGAVNDYMVRLGYVPSSRARLVYKLPDIE